MARGEGIKRVADLFEAYKKRLKAPQRTVVQCFVEVVEDVCGIALKASQVRYTPAARTVTLSLPGQIRTEILLQKDEVLTHLKGRLGSQSAPKDII